MHIQRVFLISAVIACLFAQGCDQQKERAAEPVSPAKSEPHKTDNTLSARNVSAIVVRDETIRVGTLSDELFRIRDDGRKLLRDEDHLGREIIKDPLNPNSLMVTHHYKVDGQVFDIILTRPEDPGPYKVKEIILREGESKKESDCAPLQATVPAARNVKQVTIGGIFVKVGQDAYIPQGRLESYFVRNEGDIMSTHDSYYSHNGKTYIVTYGPGPTGTYVVTEIKVCP